MKLPSLWAASPLSAALLLTFTLVSAVPIAAQAEWPQLTDSNFSSSVSKGLWFVEFFSPQCSHCKKFAPTWEELVIAKTRQWGPYGFFMAQVNCLAQGDLCDANGIEAYPTMKLFHEGLEVKKFSGKRTFDNVSSFIDTNTQELFSRKEGMSRPVLGERPNLNGEVLVLDAESLQERKADGSPLFVKFYAPWCGHCKKLAPTWRELADTMKGVLTIAELDCEMHKSLCKTEDVRGFPQLIFYQAGEKTEYRGRRGLADMQDWATKAISASGVADVGLPEVEALIGKEQVFFLYMYTFLAASQNIEEIENAAKALLGTPPVFKTHDPDVFNLLGVDPSQGAALVVIKDHEPRAAATFPLADSHARSTVMPWVLSERLPTMAELSTHNFDEVMRNPSKPIVVLASLDEGSSQGQAVLLQAARAWRQSGMKVLDRPVIFVWMDSTKWAKWLKSMYAVKAANGPAVIISDHSALRYYDRDATNQKITLDQQSIFSALDAIDRGVARGKHSENIAERAIRNMNNGLESLGRWATSRPYTAGGVVVLLFIGLMWGVRRLVLADMAPIGSYPNGYHKPEGRLD